MMTPEQDGQCKGEPVKMLRAMVMACVSGVLVNLAFPPLGYSLLAFAAFLPVMHAMDASPWRRLAIGLVLGFTIQGLGYYWIFYTIRDFGGQPAGLSFLGALLFCVYQGLDMALWLWSFPFLLPLLPRRLRPLAPAACFFLIQADLFPYVFPWCLGASLSWPGALVKGAALYTGAGLTFWVLVFQGLLFWGIRERWGERNTGLVCALCLGAVVMGGLLGTMPGQVTRDVRVCMVQPNLIPWAKQGQWSAEQLFQAHASPTRELQPGEVDLVLWPETALAFPLDRYPLIQQRVQELSTQLNAGIITGALSVADQGRLFNEIWLFTPDTAAPQIYRKRSLVLFSETLPWFLRWALMFDPALGSFQAGKGPSPFAFRGMTIMPLVCFEGMKSTLLHHQSGHLLVNLTNDAWFGPTKASSLHLAHIVMRAVEAQVPMARATNSGISAWIDAQGKVHGDSPLYENALIRATVPTPETAPHNISWLGLWTIRVMAWSILGVALFRGLRGTRPRVTKSC